MAPDKASSLHCSLSIIVCFGDTVEGISNSLLLIISMLLLRDTVEDGKTSTGTTILTVVGDDTLTLTSMFGINSSLFIVLRFDGSCIKSSSKVLEGLNDDNSHETLLVELPSENNKYLYFYSSWYIPLLAILILIVNGMSNPGSSDPLNSLTVIFVRLSSSIKNWLLSNPILISIANY